jgi:hypothetical protein
MGIARILMRQQHPAEALPLLKQVVDEDPLNGEAHYRYARALQMSGQRDAAHRQMQIYQVVRNARQKVIQLYEQMNRRVGTPADQPNPEQVVDLSVFQSVFDPQVSRGALRAGCPFSCGGKPGRTDVPILLLMTIGWPRGRSNSASNGTSPESGCSRG